MIPAPRGRHGGRRSTALRPARLRPADVVRLGGTGLRTRPLRVFLSALGIAIGVAAMIAVVGISGSGQAEVDRRLDALGTNLLRVAPGATLTGQKTRLPVEAVPMIDRIPPVREVAATGTTDAKIYRNERIAVGRTGSLAVLAADDGLLPAVGGRLRRGRWLDAATERYPAVVLGATAAQRLDVYTPGTRVWLGGRWFSLSASSIPYRSLRSWTVRRSSAGRPPGRTCGSTATPRRSTSAPRTAPSRRYGRCSRPRRTRRSPGRCRSPAPPTRSRPGRPPSRR
ncbi:hypothetical protein STANM309S_03342 [Streptomyces tanashiensis]